MRSLLTLAVAVMISSPALADMQCRQFYDHGTLSEIELSEDLETATVRSQGDEPVTFSIGTCGTGLVGMCPRSEEAGGIDSMVPVYGTLNRADKPTGEFLIVNGASMFEATCGIE